MLNRRLAVQLFTIEGDWRSVGGSNVGLREEVLVEAVSLLSNLCEASSSALEVFNQAKLMENVLLRHIDATVHGYYVVTSVMQVGPHFKICSDISH